MRNYRVNFHFSAKGGAGAGYADRGVDPPADIKALKPTGDLEAILLEAKAGSLQATAQGDGKPYDFVSRFFAPHFGVPEDPVTGSAHGALVPFWAKRLNKKTMKARQVSARARRPHSMHRRWRARDPAGDPARFI